MDHDDVNDERGRNEDELFRRLEADLDPDSSQGTEDDGDVRVAGDRRGPWRWPRGRATAPAQGGGPDAGPGRGDDGEVLEGELLEPVDRPPRRNRADDVPIWHRDTEARPVLPAWLRSADELRLAAGWAWSYAWRTVAFHAVRSPLYATLLTLRSPRGLLRVLREFCEWLWDGEARPARTVAIDRNDLDAYMKLRDRRDARVRLRLFVAVPAGVLTAVGLLLLPLAPAGPRWTVLLALSAALGWYGTPADAPLLTRAVVPNRPVRLTSDLVIRALGSLGIAGINQSLAKGGQGIAFPAPITRDGRGWRADVDLPYGVTVSDILDRRERLASGLRRPLGAVWPESAHEQHAGRLVLWVGDQDMSKVAAPPWPLLRRGRVDLFGPIPFGHDPRGRLVTIDLMENNKLIGSLPGAGKTSAVRVDMLAAALDPTCELWVYELKGSGDLAAAEKVAHRYTSGIDDESIAAALAGLRDLKAEIQRRTVAVKNLPRDVAPDGKVTRAVADRRSLGLHPLMVVIDECQNLYAHPLFGKEAGELTVYCIKLGRALGVMLVLATQRPDADSLPTGVSANVSIRFCLRVMGQVENDMILGTSAYKNGIRATTLRPTDRGIGYLVGSADDPLIVRASYVDKVAAERVADRARALRVAAGTLDGYAAGHAPTIEDPAAATLLDDVATVVGTEAKMWSETIVARLAELRPALYTGWAPDQLAAALKPHGVSTGQVWGRTQDGRPANRRGIDRAQLTAALTDRDRNRPPG